MTGVQTCALPICDSIIRISGSASVDAAIWLRVYLLHFPARSSKHKRRDRRRQQFVTELLGESRRKSKYSGPAKKGETEWGRGG